LPHPLQYSASPQGSTAPRRRKPDRKARVGVLEARHRAVLRTGAQGPQCGLDRAINNPRALRWCGSARCNKTFEGWALGNGAAQRRSQRGVAGSIREAPFLRPCTYAFFVNSALKGQKFGKSRPPPLGVLKARACGFAASAAFLRRRPRAFFSKAALQSTQSRTWTSRPLPMHEGLAGTGSGLLFCACARFF
jgi:hypothetical protein